MTVTVMVDGRAVPLSLDRQGDRWTANGRAASILEAEPGVYSVLLGGRSFEARIERTEEAWAVTIGGRRFEIEVVDPRRMIRRPRGLGQEGRQRVTAPMPGKVVRVLVAEGDAVEAGQGIAVIEAMKMQNELKAPKSGRVAALPAREGATVAAGEVLAEIE
ncbi:MAG: biotin/lipoyl-containing protein [Bryobacteraceae bacterium]|jgi:biotin carboxyl carrier protein